MHSFRTVITDFGANFGYIISKSGFQEGAYQAAKNSNVQLLTWKQFLERFEMRWLESMFERLHNEGFPLREYTDPLSMKYFNQIDEVKRQDFNNQCDELRYLAISTSKVFYEPPNGIGQKEHIDAVIQSIINQQKIGNINSYNDFFEYMFNMCKTKSEYLEEEFNLSL